MDIVLTTYPREKSQNVGDNLITQSALQLARSSLSEYNPEIVYREKSLDGFSRRRLRSILAPGFSINNDIYPGTFKLYSDMQRLKNFFPVGCSFQSLSANSNVFFETPYNEPSRDLLLRIADMSGPIPCRDDMIVRRLEYFSIPAVYSGDLAIYDSNVLNTEFDPPKSITSFVFTIGHHLKYLDQALRLLKLCKRVLPDAKSYIAFHSRPGNYPRTIADWAVLQGYEILDLSGNVSNLDIYKTTDLHVGYRLHGHICSLRNRKPSILMVEDARAFGFSRTEGTKVGCIDASHPLSGNPLEDAADKAIEFLGQQIVQEFSSYQPTFDFIDRAYASFILPFFRSWAKRVSEVSYGEL